MLCSVIQTCFLCNLGDFPSFLIVEVLLNVASFRASKDLVNIRHKGGQILFDAIIGIVKGDRFLGS